MVSPGAARLYTRHIHFFTGVGFVLGSGSGTCQGSYLDQDAADDLVHLRCDLEIRVLASGVIWAHVCYML